MSCCDPPRESPLESLPAGLSSLPRQLRGFAEVRRDLLRALGREPGPLAGWRPSGDDFGLMWLEMWAYVSDVLGFYDERVANETYLRTAARRPSLRRIVELLGYAPSLGVAARARVAAIADGAVAVTLPVGTGFRSSAFGGEPPQVFETTAETVIHPLKNQWKVASFKRHPTVDTAPDVTDTAAPSDQKKAAPAAPGPNVRTLLFETAGFGLAAGELALLSSRQGGGANAVEPTPTLVKAAEPFEGKDSLTYLKATFEPPVLIPAATDLSTLRARRPTQAVTPTTNQPIVAGAGKSTPPSVENVSGETRVFLDQAPGAFRGSDPVIVARNLGGAEAQYAFATITGVRAAAVRVNSIPPQPVSVPQPTGPDKTMTIPSPAVPATELTLQPALPAAFVSHPNELTLLFDFVEGGQPTNVGKTEVTAAELADPEGIPLEGISEPPPGAAAAAAALGISQSSNVAGVLEQEFLIADAAGVGVAADGRITFMKDGRASFHTLSAQGLPPAPLRLPLTVYGNVVRATRGESVRGEVLGDGDARVPNQRFKLKKKPLTYLPTSAAGSAEPSDTLQVWVDGVLWRRVKTFFGAGPQEQVYTVRHDDEQNTYVTFGDGVRGARLPSGVQNVVASYRFGSGAAAPPAGSINQLAGSVKGLRAARAPVGAEAGKGPDLPGQLRTNAPRTALLFGRAVSAADFEALARQQPGVVQARAQWLWIQSQMQAGVVVQYVGDADPAAVVAALRAQADPTVPVEVAKAQPIPATVNLGVEVDPRYVKESVAADVKARLTEPGAGVLSRERAHIGGTFWPSALYQAVSQVPGVLGVAGVSFSTGPGGPNISNSKGTCIETGKYLDFSAAGAVTVAGVSGA